MHFLSNINHNTCPVIFVLGFKILHNNLSISFLRQVQRQFHLVSYQFHGDDVDSYCKCLNEKK